MGGDDIEDNYTYLTVREHQIAHYLLWKIHGNINDLRAMHMLGANLTSYQRRLTGKWCYDNKVGFFNEKWDDVKKEWGAKGANTQIKNKIGIHNPKNFSKYASLGGKIGAKSQIKNNVGIHTNDQSKRNKWASLGGKAMQGMICVTNGTHRTRIRPEKLDEYLANGYCKGFTLFS